MKRLVIALGIIGAIAAIAIISLLMLWSTCNAITEQAESICKSLDEKNIDNANRQSQQLEDYWEEHRGVLSFFFRRYQISEISISITMVRGLLQYNDTALAGAFCQQISHRINEFWKGELPLPGSIL
ncbi:DUF4363 family protein [Acetanaerobacterium elongatum]|uniref:DUF4363 family protein n=1 Tax=Acetanaerobacterium elongatum TaxID=258515 RepID=A0A1H0FFS9_9FIRM|nr:DUF4363 family protein [Acetanaerobacterium elongatum]SDN93269.1 protein of unknown function [Acetanaerobacterium elongatum]